MRDFFVSSSLINVKVSINFNTLCDNSQWLPFYILRRQPAHKKCDRYNPNKNRLIPKSSQSKIRGPILSIILKRFSHVFARKKKLLMTYHFENICSFILPLQIEFSNAQFQFEILVEVKRLEKSSA